MTGFAVKGWCPDAWRPMMAGDGLLVRVRPRLGRLTAPQALGLCEAAITLGNGLIDMTSRANLQVRGVTANGWQTLIDRLVALELVDPDPVIEARRSIVAAPGWHRDDDTGRIAEALMTRLGDLPDLPAKTGFAIDAGIAPVLSQTPSDFRIERGQSGRLILRADGRGTGAPLAPGTEAEALIALAHWFAETGGTTVGRMARHHAPLPDWATGSEHPMDPGPRTQPGEHGLGAAYGLPFGRLEAGLLADGLTSTAAKAMWVTPWRIAIFEGANPGSLAGFLHDRDAPPLRTDACPGMPDCPQATVETRDLAARLAPHIIGRLHVSGCAKGCARAKPADVVLTGRAGLFDLALHARAGDPAVRIGLTADRVLACFGAT